jgi:hypothetical protein
MIQAAAGAQLFHARESHSQFSWISPIKRGAMIAEWFNFQTKKYFAR